MKKLFLVVLLFGFSFGGSVSAQTASDFNEGVQLVYDPSDVFEPYSLNFWGRSGYLYYLEETEDLTANWDYFGFALIGGDAAASVRFDSPPSARFFRLRFTNDPNSDLFGGDFDSDLMRNYDEVLLGMNPFFDEGPLNLTGDEDGDGVLNEFDAAPYRSSVGALSVAVISPAEGVTIE